MKILVAVDGSEVADRAVGHVIALARAGAVLDIHVLNVRIPIESGHVRLFVHPRELEAYYRDEGLADLAKASRLLDEAGLAHTDHIAVGHTAVTIARYTDERGFDALVMGTHGRGGLRKLMMGSVAQHVLLHVTRPVTFVK
ncbi:MAG: universal stress protein [Zoogloeaceae bacterium]|nr:universal stress protein [Zoogloeaceae bacterium]